MCRNYWPPLYAFLRRQGHDEHDAKGRTQECFARLLEKNDLADVAREKGRFRSFLLAAMKHFLANEWNRARAQKRGGGLAGLALEFGGDETRIGVEPAHNESADKLYDRRWALTLLDLVMARLRTEHGAAGKGEMFDALKGCLMGDRSTLPYAALAAKLGMTEGAVKVSVHRLRERYRRLLRAEIANTVGKDEEVEDELRHLMAALTSWRRASAGWQVAPRWAAAPPSLGERAWLRHPRHSCCVRGGESLRTRNRSMWASSPRAG